ncbi:MAG TPA: hypothetical protein VFK57_01030 [Vicinamibacterales bacterium]|nr:hypothetical protein [Vicinamibacterales bacterium]
MRLFLLLPAVTVAALLPGCHATIRSTQAAPPTADQMAELWVEPERTRDLYWGVGGQRLAPDPAAIYKVLEVKRTGFSMGLTVEGPGKRKWSAKMPPEAPTEVVASRLLWGLGYHQPPIYYMGKWNAEGAPDPNPQLPSRFRESKPDLHGLDDEGIWSYYRNPFVGTRQLNGLLIMQVMLGNSDLKDEQNALYVLTEKFEGASRWYVARDLGQSFGRTGVIDAPRGDPKVFEETPFIKGMAGQYVRFDYRGRHGALVDRMTAADVRWICERLQRLTDKQWTDAFRAGGYAPQVADRFIRRFKQKVQEGLALGR